MKKYTKYKNFFFSEENVFSLKQMINKHVYYCLRDLGYHQATKT